MTLHATLRANRTVPGILEARNETGRVGGPWECYGKADNAMASTQGNPARNPLRKFGDTPTGVYALTVGPAQSDVRTYGTQPVIMMAALAGDCVQAVVEGRRAGLWVHGGDLNPLGKLRPTYGCLRVHNETIAAIHELAEEFGPLEELTVTEE